MVIMITMKFERKPLSSLFQPKNIGRVLIAIVCIAVTYGGGRLYYRLTDGFVESNIMYDVPKDPRWQTVTLTGYEKEALAAILSQPFYYLGKGCQSYVFASQDGQYVIK